MLKIYNRSIGKRCEISSKLTNKTPEGRPSGDFILLNLNIFDTLF